MNNQPKIKNKEIQRSKDKIRIEYMFLNIMICNILQKYLVGIVSKIT